MRHSNHQKPTTSAHHEGGEKEVVEDECCDLAIEAGVSTVDGDEEHQLRDNQTHAQVHQHAFGRRSVVLMKRKLSKSQKVRKCSDVYDCTTINEVQPQLLYRTSHAQTLKRLLVFTSLLPSCTCKSSRLRRGDRLRPRNQRM